MAFPRAARAVTLTVPAPPEPRAMAEPSAELVPAPHEPPGAPEPAPIIPLVRLLPPPPDGTIINPPEPLVPPRRSWFVAELWADLRLAVRMYFDPRYRLSRLAQITTPLFVGLLALNYFLFGVWITIPVLSPIVERVLCAVLSVLAYRVLLRELDRYRTVLDYLARYAPNTVPR
jgi:hypothetical protein